MSHRGRIVTDDGTGNRLCDDPRCCLSVQASGTFEAGTFRIDFHTVGLERHEGPARGCGRCQAIVDLHDIEAGGVL